MIRNTCPEVYFCTDLLLQLFTVYTGIRKEFLSRINQIYYWWLFHTTYEHYNDLQLTKLNQMENCIQKIINAPA